MGDKTVHQHTTPETYLKNFYNTEQLWVSDVNNKAKPFLRNVNDIYVNNIYEFIKNGEIVLPNFNEKEFGDMESDYPKFLKKLKRKVELGEMISEKEKEFWMIWIDLQLFRTEKTIKFFDEIAKEMFGLSKEDAHNFTNSNTIPFVGMYKSVKNGEQYDSAFKRIYDVIKKMKMRIFYIDDEREFITSDNPVIVNKLEQIIFPVNSKIAFVFDYGIEGVYDCSNEYYDYIMGCTIANANRHIYSKERMRKSQIKSYRGVVTN